MVIKVTVSTIPLPAYHRIQAFLLLSTWSSNRSLQNSLMFLILLYETLDNIQIIICI
jgi:hypothetical protein